jgi:hypothetical protein
MFIAVFMPLPQAKPQLPQQYARSDSARISLDSPHLEHVLLSGRHLSTDAGRFPCSASSQASIARNIPQPLPETILPK